MIEMKHMLKNSSKIPHSESYCRTKKHQGVRKVVMQEVCILWLSTTCTCSGLMALNHMYMLWSLATAHTLYAWKEEKLY